MTDRFGLQIVNLRTGEVVVGPIRPGQTRGRTEERDLIDRVLARAQAKGVGALRTEAHTLAAFRQAMTETFMEAKSYA